ncbi:MAG: hypothetical protein H0V73_00245 [Chloroflexi bacterium]|nr:hypothetical protein [Chloroflexota bacterium]
MLDQGERIHAEVLTADAIPVAAAADAAGLDASVTQPNRVSLTGDPGRILALLDPLTTRAVSIRQDETALRWIPGAAPLVAIPIGGRPYLLGGLPGDLGGALIPSPQRESMLGSLAQIAQTIDGRPYATLDVSGGCDRQVDGFLTCSASVVGAPAGAVRGEDWWTVHGSEKAGWRGLPEPGGGTLTGVPRPILRAVEWIARHDPETLAGIGRYERCCDAWWHPGIPGRITLDYQRDCETSVERAGRPLADTGDCLDHLIIDVDLATARVIGLAEHEGP